MADRISDLPDAILCHILSFLPTKQAVATSVLSKRWIPLWRIVPTLDFDYDRRKETYSGFLVSVSAVLLLRDWHQSIQKFRLRCCSVEFHDPTYVSKLIHVALQSRVEHLHLSLFLNWNRRLERGDPIISIINCSTLVVLNLEELILQPPSSPHFPLLQILHMTKVGFPHVSCVPKFLSGCPILEELNLNTILSKDVTGYANSCISIINCSTLAVLKLKNLEIKFPSSPYFPSLKVLHMENVFIEDPSWLSKFVSGCPNIKDLKQHGYTLKGTLKSIFHKCYLSVILFPFFIGVLVSCYYGGSLQPEAATLPE